jgi:tetratricopeptide (TPR) repeat protein
MSEVLMSLIAPPFRADRWMPVITLVIGVVLCGLPAEPEAARKAQERAPGHAAARGKATPLPQSLPVQSAPLQFIASAEGRTSLYPVRIDRVDAEVEIAGLRATTRLTLDWTPLPSAETADLPGDDGALWLPLSGDQQVTAVAVQTLDQPPRPAVALGTRQLGGVREGHGPDAAWDRGVVPAFRLALHPWWSSASSDRAIRQGRRVILQIEQTLVQGGLARGTGSAWAWMLPVGPTLQPCPVRLKVRVHDELPLRGPARSRQARWLGPAAAAAATATFAAAPVADSGVTVWSWQSPAHLGPVGLQLATPEHTVISLGAQQVFAYAEVPFADWVQPRRVRQAHAPKSRTMALIWDASATRAFGDHGRELELIERWLGRLDRGERLDIDLYIGRERAEPAGHFRVGAGNWSALRRALEQISYAGIGLPQAWKVPAGADQVLLFSDGLEPDPEAPETGPAVPAGRTGPVLHAVLASPQADEMRLRRLAEASGGRLIDLLRQTPESAAADLVRAVPRIVSIRSKGLRDLHIVSRRPELGRLVLAAGVVHSQEQPLKAQATLVLRWPGGDTEERVIDFSRVRPAERRSGLSGPDVVVDAGPGPADLATQRWLALQMRSLGDPAQRERLARRHGVGMPAGPMVVLAQATDYARLRLHPPEAGSLRADYQRARNQPQPVEVARGWPQRQERIERLWSHFGTPGAVEASAAMAEVRGGEPPPSALGEMVLSARLSSSALTTQDDDWIERLRLAPAAARAKVLAEESRLQSGRAVFDLVAADLLFGLGDAALAVRTLSSLIDVELEDPTILRAVVLRMLASRQPDLAALAARRWVHLRPFQAEAWYALAQAQLSLGLSQEAFSSLDQGLMLAPQERHGADTSSVLQPDLAPLILDEMRTLAARMPQLHSFHQLEQTLPTRPSLLRIQLSSDAGMLSRLRWLGPSNGSTHEGASGDCPGLQAFGTLSVGTEQLCRLGASAAPGRHELWLDPGSQWPLPLALARVRLSQGDGATAQERLLWVHLRAGQPQRLAVIDIDEQGAIRSIEVDEAVDPAAVPQIPRLSERSRLQM